MKTKLLLITVLFIAGCSTPFDPHTKPATPIQPIHFSYWKEIAPDSVGTLAISRAKINYDGGVFPFDSDRTKPPCWFDNYSDTEYVLHIEWGARNLHERWELHLVDSTHLSGFITYTNGFKKFDTFPMLFVR